MLWPRCSTVEATSWQGWKATLWQRRKLPSVQLSFSTVPQRCDNVNNDVVTRLSQRRCASWVSSVFSFLILKVILSNWTYKVGVVFKKLTEEQYYGLYATLILGKWCYAGQHYWSFCSITMFTKVLLEFLKWIRHSLSTCHNIPHPLIKCTLISYSC